MPKFLVHHYDKNTHEYLRSGLDANENPKRPGQAMIPGNATTKEPPQVGEHQKAVFIASGPLPDAGDWEIQSDYRDVTYYNKETKTEVKLLLGQDPDAALTEMKPEHDQVWDDASNSWLIPLDVLRQQKDAEIRTERWQAEEQGSITYQGLTFPTDGTSQNKLNSAISLAREGFLPPAWQGRDGILPISDIQQLIDLGLLVGKYVELQFQQQFQLLIQLAQAETREEISSIVWPGAVPMPAETTA